ncbi:MAG: ABC-F family ATP-binding cassette domain-containing protein [Syntrophobacteraceae bacterium]
MITVQSVNKLLGKKDLFQDVSLHIHTGNRVGLVGPNGAGKTTLFHIIMGDMEPDSGSVARAKGLRIGYLPQQWRLAEDKTVIAHAMDVHQQLSSVREELERIGGWLDAEKDPEEAKALALRQGHLIERLEHFGGYDLEARARKVLAGLGFRDERMDRSALTLSGGWLMRLELARLLLSEPDILLLDEPTNHLDLDSLLWLEQHLLSSTSAMIIISHDRVFLNRIVRRVLELEHGRLSEYTGNYDDYLRERAQRREIELAAYKNQQDRIKQVERFIEKNRYQKTKARQVQSRVKMLDKVERIELSERDESIRFSFPEPERSGKRVLELENVAKSYGSHVVYTGGIDLVIERGDRVAFMGPNGAGKSTLLKILAGVEDVTGGKRIVGHNSVLGYYAQHQSEQLNPEWTALEEVSSVGGDLAQSKLRALLGSFLFRGDDVLKKVAALSGGEKARLILCKLLLQKPNVLLLDEPTNHLDISSRDVLEQALGDFTGSICFISHDRHFIDVIANKVLLVDGGKINLFPGNYQDYLNIWKARLEGEALTDGMRPADGSGRGAKSADAAASRKAPERKKLEAAWRNELYALKKPLQKRVESLEASLEIQQTELDALNAQLADPDTYQDGGRVQELQKDHQRVQAEVRRLTDAWEREALALEELEEDFWRKKEKAWEEANA